MKLILFGILYLIVVLLVLGLGFFAMYELIFDQEPKRNLIYGVLIATGVFYGTGVMVKFVKQNKK